MKQKIMESRPIRLLRSLKLSKWLAANPFFGKFWNYEMITYIIAGVLTTLVNYGVYFLMPRFPSNGLDVVLANIAAWIAAVLFAFVVNKIFVFDSPSWRGKTVVLEFFPFIACRLLSLGFDTLFVWVTIGLLNWNEPVFKLLSNVFVLLANYFASKFIIFRKKEPVSHETA